MHRGLGADAAVVAPLAALALLLVVLSDLVPAALAPAAAGAVLLVGAAAVGLRHLHRLAARLREASAREVALAHRATHDPLTGLANRTLLLERLQLELRRLRRRRGSILVAYLDVDDLKLVNDSCGHAVGDRLLHAVAQRLTTATREVDTVARVGGDEFVVVCAVDDTAAADRLIERPAAAAARPLHPGGQVGLSLGWVLSEDPADDPTTLVACADEAMYRAKARRRGERGSIWWPAPAVPVVGPRSHTPACSCLGECGCHLVGGDAGRLVASHLLATEQTATPGLSRR